MITIENLAKCHISSGDGESAATAFVFDSDYTENEAIALEYEALSELFGFEERDFVQQKFYFEASSYYDIIIFHNNGCEREVYFDITKHFGK